MEVLLGEFLENVQEITYLDFDHSSSVCSRYSKRIDSNFLKAISFLCRSLLESIPNRFRHSSAQEDSEFILTSTEKGFVLAK